MSLNIEIGRIGMEGRLGMRWHQKVFSAEFIVKDEVIYLRVQKKKTKN